jgi:hypothetical protein
MIEILVQMISGKNGLDIEKDSLSQCSDEILENEVYDDHEKLLLV